jgi:hypothetical protein
MRWNVWHTAEISCRLTAELPLTPQACVRCAQTHGQLAAKTDVQYVCDAAAGFVARGRRNKHAY